MTKALYPNIMCGLGRGLGAVQKKKRGGCAHRKGETYQKTQERAEK